METKPKPIKFTLRLTEDEMVIIRKIRLEYRTAVVTMRNTGTKESFATFREIRNRRNRVIRSLHEDGFERKQITGILGISKHTVDNAIANTHDPEDDDVSTV